MNNFEKIKAMDIDEMAEYFFNLTQICELEKKCSDCNRNSWCSSETQKDFKKWLLRTKN